MNSTHYFVCLFLLSICSFIVSCETDEKEFDINHADNAASDSLTDNEGSNDSIVGKNILQNGNVEEWELDFCEYPSHWLLPSGYCNKVTRNWDIVLAGQYSAKMKALEKGTTARISQLVKLSPGSKIKIRFNYYVEQWKTNGARTYCYFRTGHQESSSISIAELRSFYSNDEYYVIRGGGLGIKYLPHKLMSWQVFDEVISVPPNATYFEFGINSYYGTVIYVDNCYVIEIVK